jgi:hypothetical protein
MKLKTMDREDGSAAVIAVYITGLIMFLVVWIIFNPVMDAMSIFGTTGTVATSSDLLASVMATDAVYQDALILFLVFWTLSAYIASLRQRVNPT